MTEEWKADERFLDFVVKKFESDSGLKDLVGATRPLVGAGQKEYSMNDLVNEMRQGTKLGQRMYTTLYCLNEAEFEEYLIDSSNHFFFLK